MKSWHLESAETRNDRHYATFEIPERSLREDLRAKDLVKLIFIGSMIGGKPAGERMWVEISSRSRKADGRIEYKGKLKNHPATILGLRWGDEVVFGPEHVADVEQS